ncbi:glycine--tRNA ligase subunit beta [bacterium]|nr:glycine--tRNA ligase subunit beta [bacterium]
MERNFLLEIGCENLPSGYLDLALEQLKEECAAGLKNERIKFDSISTLGTPNRLVVYITNLASKQKVIEEEVTGPPVSVAVSDQGDYTRAAFGFAESQGVSVEDLKRVRRERGEYLAVVKRIPGRKTEDVLKKMAPLWITGIRFPKTMRWDGSGLRFARPIRWIFSFLGEKQFKFRVGSVSSGNKTRVRPSFDIYVEVGGIDGYFSLMQENRIVLDPAERRERVVKALRREAKRLGARVVRDDELVAVVANLLESPVPFTGRFKEGFLSLPRQVIVTALKSHQKYFSVEDEEGKLKPFFIAFADGIRKNRKEIVRGYERVLQARLADAVFYFDEDTSIPISEMAKRLSSIVWMEGMGSLADKSTRTERLSLWLKSKWNIGSDRLSDTISKAAKLAKADLASEMVKDGKEFTLLQGYMGREYARVSGEDESVAEAIYEHHLPRFAGDDMPVGEAGLIISCADKLDNISGGFILGFGPTGSVDPYALRRQAMGVLRLMIEREMAVSLPEAIDKSLSLYEESVSNIPSLFDVIYKFFGRRFFSILRAEGFDHDIVTALMSAGWEIPFLTRKMALQLSRMRKEGRLSPFILAMKRIANITGSVSKDNIRTRGLEMLALLAGREEEKLPFTPDFFKLKAETDLFKTASKAAARVLSLKRERKEDQVFSMLYQELVGPVDRYFDEVLVNCDEEKTRKNRISFLSALRSAFSYLCNYSEIKDE